MFAFTLAFHRLNCSLCASISSWNIKNHAKFFYIKLFIQYVLYTQTSFLFVLQALDLALGPDPILHSITEDGNIHENIRTIESSEGTTEASGGLITSEAEDEASSVAAFSVVGVDTITIDQTTGKILSRIHSKSHRNSRSSSRRSSSNSKSIMLTAPRGGALAHPRNVQAAQGP